MKPCLAALALILGACARPPEPAAPAAAPALIVLEAEQGAPSGLELKTEAQRTYVTGFDQEGDELELEFEADPGVYELRIVYRSPHGPKGFDLRVNEERGSGTLPALAHDFAAHSAGVFTLRSGKNRLVLGKGWGYFDVDRFELSAVASAPLLAVAPEPVNPRATPEARALLRYLTTIYGKRMLAGQQDLEDIAYVREVTGKEPALGSFDLMEYSPSRRERGADPKGLSERVIAWARPRPALVSLCFHWNAPKDLLDEPGGKEWWRGFYTEATRFDLAAALADESSEGHRLLLRDLDAIAVELRRFQHAKIPVLWRPLHEAQGGWFWWGAKGPAPFVALWRLMYERLVGVHGLHHLLWVYSPPESGILLPEWYPGDEFVDVVGVDLYAKAGDNLTGAWRALRERYDGHKLLALGESGTLPNPERAFRYDASWSWFSVWSGKFIREVPTAELRATYAHERVITRDELPISLGAR